MELLHYPDAALRRHLVRDLRTLEEVGGDGCCPFASRGGECFAVTFSSGVIEGSTWRPVRRLARSEVHRALPSGGVPIAVHRFVSSPMFATARRTLYDAVFRLPCSFGCPIGSISRDPG